MSLETQKMVDSTAMRWSLHRLFLVALAVLAYAFAQNPAMAQVGKIDVSKLGPQVGEHVPNFNLKDQSGRSWTLESIMGPKGAMLVFYRSADW